jgi:hypothetical protein
MKRPSSLRGWLFALRVATAGGEGWVRVGLCSIASTSRRTLPRFMRLRRCVSAAASVQPRVYAAACSAARCGDLDCRGGWAMCGFAIVEWDAEKAEVIAYHSDAGGDAGAARARAWAGNCCGACEGSARARGLIDVAACGCGECGAIRFTRGTAIELGQGRGLLRTGARRWFMKSRWKRVRRCREVN